MSYHHPVTSVKFGATLRLRAQIERAAAKQHLTVPQYVKQLVERDIERAATSRKDASCSWPSES